MIRRCRPFLGTYVEIAAGHERAIETGFETIARIHSLMSVQEADSELSRLNRSGPGSPVRLSPDTLAVLDRALAWAQRSGGLFDPVRAGRAAVRSQLLKLHSGQPQPAPDGDWNAIRMIPPFAWLERPACVDLGGIAKGYALDVAAQSMRRAGARWGFINAGGDAIAYGKPQRVQIVDPFTRMPVAQILLDGEAIATSSALPDGSTNHLPDADGAIVSLSIVAPCGIDADALTKIAIGGHDRIGSLLHRAGARALALHADARIVELAA